jgi:hypothetical protein
MYGTIKVFEIFYIIRSETEKGESKKRERKTSLGLNLTALPTGSETPKGLLY